jgi:putative peptidoglycan lipid II flippase
MARIFIYSFWTVVVQAVSIFRDILLAKYFGTGPDLHTWLVILIAPGFIASAILSAFPGALVPWISPLSRETLPSSNELMSLASSIAKKTFLALLIAGIATAMFNSSEIKLVLAAIGISAVQVLIGYLRGLVQSLKKVSWVVGSPVVSTVFVCALLFFQAEKWGIAALPVGLLIGYLLEAVILYSVVLRSFQSGKQTKSDLPGVEKNFWGIVFAGLAMSSTLYVDQLSAQWLFGGGIPELTYGNKITAAIVGLMGGALSVLLFPGLASIGSKKSFKKYVYKASAWLFVLGFFSAAVLIFFSKDLIQILFERGKFQSADTEMVSLMNIYFLCQLPFYLGGILGVYALQILKKSGIIVKIAVINTVNNLVLNIILGRMMGLPGIALSTAIVYFGSMVMIFYNLREVQHE